MNIGFVGLGKLGFPVALAIGSRGHAVRGWDASRSVRADVEAGRLPQGERGAEEMARHSSVRVTPVPALVRESERNTMPWRQRRLRQ